MEFKRVLFRSCKDCWMSGSATFTTVMSNRSMNVPVHTAIRVHHFLSITSSLVSSGFHRKLMARRLTPAYVPRVVSSQQLLQNSSQRLMIIAIEVLTEGGGDSGQKDRSRSHQGGSRSE